MTNTDWLDEIILKIYRLGEKDHKEMLKQKAAIFFGSDTDPLKQQILTHISDNYVTKEECERRVLEAKLDVMYWALKGHSVEPKAYCETMNRNIEEVKYELNELEELSNKSASMPVPPPSIKKISAGF